MRKYILLSLSLLLVVSFTFSQRISSAVNFNAPFGGMIHFKQNYYSPQNYFRIYFVNEPNEENERYNRFSIFGFGKWYKSIGFGAGYTAKIDYKRFAIRLGYQFTFMNTNIKLNQFNDGGDYGAITIDEYPAEFKIQTYHHRFPLTFSVDLQKKNNSPFVFFGAEYGYIFSRMEAIDWDFSVFYDRYSIPYMYGHFYDNSGSLLAIAGYGFKRKRIEWMFSLKTRIDNGKNKLTMTHSILDFNMNFYLSYKTIKRKHILFIDE